MSQSIVTLNAIKSARQLNRASDEFGKHCNVSTSPFYTYFIALFEALGLDSGRSVRVDGDARRVFGTEHVIDFADKLLFLRPDHAGKQGHTIAFNHADDLTFADMRHLSHYIQSLGRPAIVATTYNI